MIIAFVGVSLGIAPKISFAGNKYNKQERIKLLTMTAYYSDSNLEVNKGNKNFETFEDAENFYLSLSDAQFENTIKESIESTIKAQKGGKKVIWNKNFLNNELKLFFPNLYTKVTNITKNDPAFIKEIHTKIAPLSSGSNTITGIYSGYSSLGFLQWSFYCQMHWAWHNNEITNVSSSQWAATYLTWEYDGIIANAENYYNNRASYYKYVKGQFELNAFEVPIQYDYPWQKFYLHVGGGYEWSCGG